MGHTPLHIAALNGNFKMVNMLLESDADPNVVNKDGFTALMFAAHFNNDKIATSLLDKGARVEAVDKDADTAVCIASVKGHTKMVELLIDYQKEVPENHNRLSQTMKRLGFKGTIAEFLVNHQVINTRTKITINI
jgi:ankyrin repeat protein